MWGELYVFQKCDINLHLGTIFTFFSEQQIPGIVQVACTKQHRSWMTLQKTWNFLTLQQQTLGSLFLLFEVFHWTDTDSPGSYWKGKKYCNVDIKPTYTTLAIFTSSTSGLQGSIQTLTCISPSLWLQLLADEYFLHHFFQSCTNILITIKHLQWSHLPTWKHQATM